MPRLKSGLWPQLFAAYSLNVLCAWMIFFEEDCDNVGQNFCNAVRPLHMLWQPLLGGLVTVAPALLGLSIAAITRAFFTGATYFAGALVWTCFVLEIYLRDGFAPDGHGCINCMAIVVQLLLNVAWLPVSVVLCLLEWWIKRKAEEGS
jgi:hypothetical protein